MMSEKVTGIEIARRARRASQAASDAALEALRPEPPEDAFRLLEQILQLAVDPVTAQRRLDELTAARDAANRAKAEAVELLAAVRAETARFEGLEAREAAVATAEAGLAAIRADLERLRTGAGLGLK